MRGSFRYYLIILLLACIVSACQSTGVQRTVRKGNGHGFIKWETIPAAESKISIIDEEGLVQARREKLVPHKKLLSQAFRLPNGSILYEKREKITADFHVLTSQEEIINRYASHKELLAKGLLVKEENIVQSSGITGDFSHVVIESAEKRCVIFFGYAEGSTVHTLPMLYHRNYEALTGSICEQQGTASSETLEKDVMAFLSRIRFDDGEYTRKQLLAKAFKKLDVLEEERLKEAAKDQVGPEIKIANVLEAEENNVWVMGRITDDSEIDMVRIDNAWVKLKSDGSFSAKVQSPVDRNYVQLVALDQYGNRSEKNIEVISKKVIKKPAPAEIEYGSYSALLIGNSEYQHWRDLDTPRYDVHSLSEVLNDYYGFTYRRILVDASQEEIISALNEIRNQMDSEDNLLIYFSGHGILHKGKGYWVPIDGYLDDPEKWIPNVEINRALRRIPAKHVIVVADSCYSGTLAQKKISLSGDATVIRRSRTAMSAGSGEEVVLEPVLAEGEEDNSVFAKKLINVLKTNPKIVRNGYDIFNEVKSLLVMYPQHPQYGALEGVGHENGSDFFFVKKK